MATATLLKDVPIIPTQVGVMCTRTPATYKGPVPGSACAFKRAASIAANERKVFILHDEGENATGARFRTGKIRRIDPISLEILTSNCRMSQSN